MADNRPILYHSQLSGRSLRLRRRLREIGVEVEERNVLLSHRHREELRRIAGAVRVPCLVVCGNPMQEPDEIYKFLQLRYGSRD